MAVKKDLETGKWFCYGKYKNIMGETKQFKKRGFDTKREAKDAESIFLQSNKECSTSMTLNELHDEFINFSRGRKKETTVNKDIQYYRLHIKDYFGHKKYKDITVKEIVRWQNELIKTKKLSTVYINTLMKSFNKLFTYATKIYLTTYNPVSIAGKLKEPKREYITWNEKDFNKFIRNIDDLKIKTAFQLLYFTGMRRGEFLALQWKDYDGSKIKISKTCSQAYGGYIITDPKTSNSFRTIEIDKQTKYMLDEYKLTVNNYDGFNEDWYIFGSIKPLAFNELGRQKDKYAQIAKLPNIRIHDFRHSHVSMLINNNIPLPAIANRAGDTIETILETYSHLFEKSNKELMNLLNKVQKSMPKVCHDR